MLNEESIRSYAQLMKELDLTSIEVSEDNRSIRLERQPSTVIAASVPAGNVSVAQPAPAAAPAPAVAAGAETVKSPMVGVFYAAPAENADPYVKVGDHVSKGDTLCIIEAMKLMNEIPCEYDGVITEILGVNGQVVEYGAPLFRIERD